MTPTPDIGEGRPVDPSEDDSFFTWYHHAVAIGYSVSAVVSMSSLPVEQMALYGAGSLLGAYVVVAVLTLVWRRLVPRLL